MAPGMVLTKETVANMTQELLDAMLENVAAPRHGKAEYIAAAVAYLLSDDAEWVTGQYLRVNGGLSFN